MLTRVDAEEGHTKYLCDRFHAFDMWAIQKIDVWHGNTH